MQRLRGLLAQQLQQPDRRPIGREVLDIVDDQREISATLSPDCFGECGREDIREVAAARAAAVQLGASGNAEPRRRSRLQSRQPDPQGLDQTVDQHWDSGVGRSQGVPRARGGVGPGHQQGGLAAPAAGDDGGEASA